MKAELVRRRPLTSGIKTTAGRISVEFTYNPTPSRQHTHVAGNRACSEGVTIDKKPLKDHLEAVGHRDAFLYVVSLVSDKVAISERIIREIHSLVLINKPEDKGVYRRIPVKIMGAHHEPPQPYLVPVQMERLLADLSPDNRHIIETAALSNGLRRNPPVRRRQRPHRPADFKPDADAGGLPAHRREVYGQGKILRLF